VEETLQTLMEAEVQDQVGADRYERTARPTAMGIATGTGRPGWAPSTCRFRSCGAGATFPPFSSRAGGASRRSRR
jgi:hypothetical protein